MTVEIHRLFVAADALAEKRAKPAATDDEGRVFSGHAAVFNLPTYIGPAKKGFYEQVAPNAFGRTLKAGADVRSVINHDPNQLLGRTASGTLRLAEDDTGLHQETDLPDTSYARDLAQLTRRGDISGQSFQFTVARESWSTMPGGHAQLRTINEIGSLIDVGPVTYPAYADTTASLRSGIFPSKELRDGVADYGLAAMAGATDAALDAAAAATGNPGQCYALLTAAASTIDLAAQALWYVDMNLLTSLGLPDIGAMIQAADSAIDAVIASCSEGSAPANGELLVAASGAIDAVLAALHLDDPDKDGLSADTTDDDDTRAASPLSLIRARLQLARHTF